VCHYIIMIDVCTDSAVAGDFAVFVRVINQSKLLGWISWGGVRIGSVTSSTRYHIVLTNRTRQSRLRLRSHVPLFQRSGANWTGERTAWNFVHTSRFSTGRQVPIIAGSWVNSGACVAYRHFHTPWFLPGRPNDRFVCIRLCFPASHYFVWR
jgi:hypothetical protein